jgi:alpha-L-fucosidase
MAKQLQPGIIVNNRLDVLHTDESHGYVGPNGDYATPEGFVAGWGGVPWETCTNLGHQWAWRWNDEPRKIGEVQQTLIRCIGGNGNLLLNVGPDSLGVIPPNFEARFRELGQWINGRSASIYGTTPGIFSPGKDYVSVARGAYTYIHFWGKSRTAMRFPAVPGKLRSVKMYDGRAVDFVSTDTALIIRPDQAMASEEMLTFILDIDPIPAKGFALRPPSVSGSLAYRVKATASGSVGQMLHDPAAAVDDNTGTHWKLGRRKDIDWHAYYGADINYRSRSISSLYDDHGWLEVDLGRAKQVSRVKVSEYKFHDSSIEGFDVMAEVDGKWIKVATDQRMGNWEQQISPVVARKFRLYVKGAEGMPGIAEFQLFEK